jgi:phospho-2-dehydro-3-deoxyheptonate aldolase
VLRSTVEQTLVGCGEIMGFMLESNIHAGKQAWNPRADLAYGVSNHGCMPWLERKPNSCCWKPRAALAARPRDRGVALA